MIGRFDAFHRRPIGLHCTLLFRHAEEKYRHAVREIPNRVIGI